MNLHRLSIAAIRQGDAVAITEAYLDRIACLDCRIATFTALDVAGARAAAAESAVRIASGTARPLEGVPFGIKANIDVAGLATTAGVEARRGSIAIADAAVVTLLRSAGAVILGHVNMHEAALGATTDNIAYGRTMNPHRIGHTAGGSSGGSGAAVAAGLCAAALGTDTLGSVRIPAAYNGVYGLKPGPGVIPDAGLVPLAQHLDAIGPLARSVADLAAVMAVLAPSGEAEPVTRVATLRMVDDFAGCEPAVVAGMAAAVAALRGLGIDVTQVETPTLDLPAARMAGFIESARAAAITFADDRKTSGISKYFNMLLDLGAAAAPDSLVSGKAAMAAVRDTLHRILDGAEVILMPTAPQAAFAHGRAPHNQADFTALANIAGLPALSLPSGLSAEGLPVAVQLVGRPGGEATLLGLAARLDAVLNAYHYPVEFA